MSQSTTSQLKAMIQSHPGASGDQATLIQCIDACLECAQVCVSCADACLGEPQLDMLRRCIRLNLDCADICGAAARVLARLGNPDPILLRRAVEAAAAASLVCAEECEQHGEKHEHCRLCAEACVRCSQACDLLLEEIA